MATRSSTAVAPPSGRRSAAELLVVLLVVVSGVGASAPAALAATADQTDPSTADGGADGGTNSEVEADADPGAGQSEGGAEPAPVAEQPQPGVEPTADSAVSPADGAVGQPEGTDQNPDPDPDPDPDPNPDTSAGIDPGQQVSDPVDGDPVDGEPVDPLANEAEGGEAPAGEVEVPADAGYNQDEFKPAEILWSSVAAAEAKLNDLTAARNGAVAEARALRLRIKELGVAQGDLAAESQVALAELTASAERMRSRAVVGFQFHSSGGRTGAGSLTADHSALVERQRRGRLVGIGLQVDEDDIERLSSLRSSLDRDGLEVLERTRTVELALAEIEAEADRLESEREQAQIEYEAFSAGSEIFVDGVAFPIVGDYGKLIDSYGFPRMPGTEDEHWHEGIDIFAARGTPLVATERGVIARLGVGRLGGLKFWLVGESGSEWYYAHLDSFAPGLANGQVVEAGQLVGHVGDTGNAVGTPPHLHMELHPGGTRPVNPFPLLNVVSQRDRGHVVAGGRPPAVLDPVVADEPVPDPAPAERALVDQPAVDQPAVDQPAVDQLPSDQVPPSEPTTDLAGADPAVQAPADS